MRYIICGRSWSGEGRGRVRGEKTHGDDFAKALQHLPLMTAIQELLDLSGRRGPGGGGRAGEPSAGACRACGIDGQISRCEKSRLAPVESRGRNRNCRTYRSQATSTSEQWTPFPANKDSSAAGCLRSVGGFKVIVRRTLPASSAGLRRGAEDRRGTSSPRTNSIV